MRHYSNQDYKSMNLGHAYANALMDKQGSTNYQVMRKKCDMTHKYTCQS